MLAAIERQSARLIGWIGLSFPHYLPEVLPAVEVGWRLGREFWGRGYATEGAVASIDIAPPPPPQRTGVTHLPFR